MPATVIAGSDKLVVESVPAFTYREGRDSLVLAMKAAAQCLQRDISYAALKGRSVLAFRLIFSQDWSRFTPDALCGYDHTSHLLDALGLSGALLTVDISDPAAVSDSKAVIQRSLADGYPILGIHLMDYEDWGVVAGITADGRLLCQTPHNESSDLAEHKHWPHYLLRISGEEAITDPRDLLLNALRVAIKIHATGHFGSFYSGRAAYRFWIEGLLDHTGFEQLEMRGEQPYDAWVRGLQQEDKDNFATDSRYLSPYLERAHVNAWRLESLIDARQSAADYLSLSAEMLTGKARSRIAGAADLYMRQVQVLSNTRSNVSWEWNLAEQPWTPEKRVAQAQALTEALHLESAAIKEIRVFLNRYA